MRKKRTAAGDSAAAANTVKAAAVAAATSSTQPVQGLLGSPEGRKSPKAGPGAGGAGGKGLTGGKGDRPSREIMESFLIKAATPSKRPADESPEVEDGRQASKKQHNRQEAAADVEGIRMEEGDTEEEEEDEDSWLDQLREQIAQKTGITAGQLAGVMELVEAAVKVRIGQEAEKAAKAAVVAERIKGREDKADRKSSRSVLIHRADLWVRNDASTQGFGLAERVTAAIFKETNGMVQVRDAFLLGRWNALNPPTSVMVEFGSMAQKATFYRVVAKVTQTRTEEGRQMQGISCRDAFPKKYIADAQRLIQQGKALRANGRVAAFRVAAQGPGCIPVLQVRHRGEGGRHSRRWEPWVGMQKTTPPPPPPRAAARGGVQQDRQGSPTGQGSPTLQRRDGPWLAHDTASTATPLQKGVKGGNAGNPFGGISSSDTSPFYDAEGAAEMNANL